MGVGIFPLGKKHLLGAVLAFVPSIGLIEHSLCAQTPTISQSQPSSEPKTHIKSRTFHFPIRIDKASQPRIREVCLYMRDGQNGAWTRLDSVPPTAKSIRCQVPHDGEFSFMVQTIDTYGNTYPTNFNQQAPAMTVVVETESQAMPVIVQGTATTTQVPVQYTIPNDVVPPLPPPPTGEGTPIPLTPPATPSQGPSVMPTAPTVTPPVVPASPSPAPSTMPVGSPVRIVNQTPPSQNPQPNVSQYSPVTQPVSQAPANRQFFNSTRIGIDFKVNRVGPSGLGKVEVYATQDQGRTWQRVGDKPGQRSPAEADLPGEGVFGIRVVATNGNGFGGKAPATGDAPSMTVEVDLTSPVIHSLEVDPVAKNGALDIRWKVTDKNLGSDAISVSYASQRTGPFTPIVSRVKNVDVLHWSLPRDVPSQLYFRLEATDLAGNVSRFDSQMPIMLDMTEPDLNVIGISAMPQRVAVPPPGN